MLAESSGRTTRCAQTVPPWLWIRFRVLATPNGPTQLLTKLEAFAMVPGQDHRMEVMGVLNGLAVIDVMRFE